MIARLGLIFFWVLAALAPAQAQTFPMLTGPVVDAANVIPDDRERALATKLLTLRQETGRQLVVATIADMEGYPLEDYGYRLGRYWKIGEKGANNGAILFIAPNNPPGQRGPRIEVGYGLEPILTDGLSRVIISTQMMPLLRQGDIPGALAAGTDAVAEQLKLPPEQAATRAKELAAKQTVRGDKVDIGSIIFWLFIFFFFILPVIRPLFFGRGRRGRRYDSGPVIIWGGGGSDWGSGGSSWGSGGGFGDGGGFSGGGGSFGGGGASGDW